MQRELEIVFRARVTWLIAALSALLIGHGFVLSLDIYSASSRSALASLLQSREMDPLVGIIRPTLGGVSLVVALLAPILAARTVAIEKERRTYGALCLAEGSTFRVLVKKVAASALGCGLILLTPILLFAAARTCGLHVDVIETCVALGGGLLHVLLMVGVGTAAAAWCSGFAQAATVGLLVSLSSWAIDAAEGFAALAWLGGASAWSLDQRLLPFQRGVVALGSLGWLLVAVVVSLALAAIGAAFMARRRRATWAVLTTLVGITVMAVVGRVQRGFDWSEQRRASLPPAAVTALRGVVAPISIDIFLDRDDSRRRQLESDTLAKLLLARPDIQLRTPLDEVSDVAESNRDTAYGRIVIHVGKAVRETRSTSRRELTTLVFEAAGERVPDWSQPPYPGYPLVLSAGARGILVAVAYGGLPLTFMLFGLALTHRRTAR